MISTVAPIQNAIRTPFARHHYRSTVATIHKHFVKGPCIEIEARGAQEEGQRRVCSLLLSLSLPHLLQVLQVSSRRLQSISCSVRSGRLWRRCDTTGQKVVRVTVLLAQYKSYTSRL
jgi:hypothetical protein